MMMVVRPLLLHQVLGPSPLPSQVMGQPPRRPLFPYQALTPSLPGQVMVMTRWSLHRALGPSLLPTLNAWSMPVS